MTLFILNFEETFLSNKTTKASDIREAKTSTKKVIIYQEYTDLLSKPEHML